MDKNLLNVKNLTVSFETDEGCIKAVDHISLHVDKGEIVGLVGESGCGKSVTALGLMRLIPRPFGSIEADQLRFNGLDIQTLSTREMRRIRGRAISMIFQEPSAALSPLHRIGRQMIETLQMHKTIDKHTAWKLALNWLQKVRLSDAKERMLAYPYQLSGGMQQRIMIAMALMLEPELIIADEPTTALDVTIQAQIFDLIRAMRRQQTSILLITHDMGVVWEMCDRVLVMYAAKIVEEGNLNDIFAKPKHPYTRGLLQSIPKLTGDAGRLEAIAGQVPAPLHYPSGCRFRDRCAHAIARCGQAQPPFVNLGGGHRSACFLAEQLT